MAARKVVRIEGWTRARRQEPRLPNPRGLGWRQALQRRAAARAWWGRTAALCALVFLGTLAGGLYLTTPERRAVLALALRDPVMDLPGPFRNCDAAQAAGWYSIPRGSPAYTSRQDADGDGLACEPYSGARFGHGLSRRLVRLRTLVR